MRVLIDGHLKFRWNEKGDYSLFDLESDPAEEYNVAEENPGRVRKMEKVLGDYLASLPPPPAGGGNQVVDEATSKALKGLGYLE